ncbi:hypothetical protein BGX28_001034, partial [Mortierella sp. GBA30]
MIFKVVWVFLLSNVASALLGVDTSALISKNAYTCLLNEHNYSRLVIRGYFEAWGNDPGGEVDRDFVTNYHNARDAGYTDIDVYMFPCTGRTTCKSAETQIKELQASFIAHDMKVGRVWLDIEIDSKSTNWPSTTPSKNKQTAEAFRDAFKSVGFNFGIYSSLSQWEQIFGNKTWNLDSSAPLWYAHYDDSPSFSDFSPF